MKVSLLIISLSIHIIPQASFNNGILCHAYLKKKKKYQYLKSCYDSCLKCFLFLLRSLSPVCVRVDVSMFQVAHFKDYIPQAFPGGHSMILDAEVLLIDTKTSKPLPFGTLGVHKVRTPKPISDFFFFFFLPSSLILTQSLFCGFFFFLISHCCHTSRFLFPPPSESCLSGCQRLPFRFRLHLLQRREPHGEVMCPHPIYLS